MPFSCERRRVDFLGNPHGVPVNSEYSQELCRTMNDLGLRASVFRNLATKRWIVLPSGTLFLPKSFLHCRCVRRTDFAAKYASMIFMRCCLVSRPVGSILVSKESPRPAVYTTWKIWKKNCKTQLWDEKQNRALF